MNYGNPLNNKADAKPHRKALHCCRGKPCPPPIFRQLNQGLKKKIKIEYRHVERIGERDIEVLWKVSANAEYGYPGPLSEAIHMAIMEILTEKGFPIQNPITFTIYDICKRLELKPSGRTYQQVRNAILSIRFAGIEIQGSFVTKEGRRPTFTDTPNLYPRVIFFGDEDPETGESIEYSAVWLADFFIDSLNSGYFRPIDFEYYKLIRKASFASPKIYNYLGYRFSASCFKHNNEYTRVDYDTLAILADVKRYKYLSDAKRSLNPAHQTLIETGFIDRAPVWQIEKQGRGEPDKFYILYYPGKRAREEYRRGRRQLTRQLEMFEGGGETPTPEIANELVALGVTESRAVRITKRHSTEQINLQLDHLAYLGEIGRPIKDNVGGWLSDAIEKRYTPPKGFETREKHEARRKAQAGAEARQQQKEQEDRRQRDEQRAQYRELDTQLSALPATDQQRITEEIETRIRAGFDDFMRRLYITKPFNPQSPVHISEYYKHLEELLK